MTTTETLDESQEAIRERLLIMVKKEVKQIMEEAVTKKFIHEECTPIITLCGSVESCIQHGLKKRALGLFKNSTTTSALLTKISKQCEAAAKVVQITAATESSQRDQSKKNGDSGRHGSKKSFNPKHLWIRIALVEKLLAKIIEYLANNADKYYEKEALIADPCDGPILASLLVGPCALEYTKMKTTDHYWSDPPADELVQRHRIHSSGNHHIRPDSPKRPGLQVTLGKRNASSSSEEGPRPAAGSALLTAREYVESLHQNNKSQLLYGKNNVIVQPKEDVEPLAGYLSLHQTEEGLAVKWTPNQLMNGCSNQEEEIDRSLYWDYAITVSLDEIVYLHCHQQPDSGGTIVLVGQDGVQRPPIHFPRGGHLLSFLSCLENGLLPHGQLDPPLWSQRGKGKVFPKLKRKGNQMGRMSQHSGLLSPVGGSVTSSRRGSVASSGSMRSQDSLFEESSAQNGGKMADEEEATDYVFRIVTAFKPPKSLHSEMMEPKSKSGSPLSGFPRPIREAQMRLSRGFATLPSPLTPPLATPPPAPSPPKLDTMQIYAKTQQQFNNTCISRNGHRTAVKKLCDTMKNQILSRAFYGWLSYCRHLKTVRTHLSGLVNTTLVHANVPYDATCGLTVEKWREMNQDGVVTEEHEIYRLVYFGGVAHEIRPEVWPYLLGHYVFGSSATERQNLDAASQQEYERTMSEWLAVEAIVKQRDKEVTAANLAKMSGESPDGHIPLIRKDSSLSNDVFESVESDDFSHPETVPEETSSQLMTPTGDEGKHPITAALAMERLMQDKSTTHADLASMSPDEGLGGSVATSGHPSTAEGSSSFKPSSGDSEGTARTSASDCGRASGSLGDEIVVTQPTLDRSSSQHSSASSSRAAFASRHNSQGSQPAGQTTGSRPGSQGSRHGSLSSHSAPTSRPGTPSRRGGSTGSVHSVTGTSVTSGTAVTRNNSSSRSSDSPRMLSAAEEDGGDVSPASGGLGGVYSLELLDTVGLNLHRIDKDVQRCDRNYAFFTHANLDKLRNIMCTYVWENLEIGYVQGMCDLLAPLLVILNDEAKAYYCFCQLMKRMTVNFPHGGAMDQHFANMRSLIQILDPEIFEHMHQYGDYTHFYFCYRWFLLDFKRELIYEDVFRVWETIWASRHVSSPHFGLFIALALVQYYREIIIDNNMDFTDIIKFFNEMAERHDAKQVLRIARDLVCRLQDLIENK